MPISGKARRPAIKTTRRVKPPAEQVEGKEAFERISRKIMELGDWRGDILARVRELIHEADPEVVEEWKWGIPVWSHAGIICTGEVYKNAVKLTFAKGASLNDPAQLFTSSLGGAVRRAVDIHAGETIDEAAFKQLIQEAVALNLLTEKKGRV